MKMRNLAMAGAAVLLPLALVADSVTLPWGWYPGDSFDYASDGAGLAVDGRGSAYCVPASATVCVKNGAGTSVFETVPGASAVGSVLLKDVLIGIDAADRATISGGLVRLPSGVGLSLAAGPAGTESVITNLTFDLEKGMLTFSGAAGATQTLANVTAGVFTNLTATGGALKMAGGRVVADGRFTACGTAKSNPAEVVVGRGTTLGNKSYVAQGGYATVRVTDGGRLSPIPRDAGSVSSSATLATDANSSGTLIVEKGGAVELEGSTFWCGYKGTGKARVEVRDGGMLRGMSGGVCPNGYPNSPTTANQVEILLKNGRYLGTTFGGFAKSNFSCYTAPAFGVAGSTRIEVDGGWYGVTSFANNSAGAHYAAGLCQILVKDGYFAAESGTPEPNGSGAKEQIILTGGILATPLIYCKDPSRLKPAGGGGIFEIYGDGGRIRRYTGGWSSSYDPMATSVDFIPYYAYVYLGTKGLAVESDSRVTISAPFFDNTSDKSSFLSLEGRGEKTLTSTNSLEKTMYVAGGKTIFGVPKYTGTGTAIHSSTAVITNGAVLSLAGTGTATTLKGLDLACGALELDEGDLFTVDGDVSIGVGAVMFTSDFAAAGTRDVFLATNTTVAAAAKTAWANAVLLQGRAAGFAYAFTTRVVEGGGTMFSVTATEDAGVTAKTFTYAAGGKDFTGCGTENTLARSVASSETWENLKLPARVVAEVAEGATLTVKGVEAGRIVKRGAGKIVLDGTNSLGEGFDSDGGLVDVRSASALGTRGFPRCVVANGTVQVSNDVANAYFPMQMTLGITNEYNSSYKTYCGVAVLKADSDVRMPYYSTYTGRGNNFIKRGAGTVTFQSRCIERPVYFGVNVARDPAHTSYSTTTFNDDGTVTGKYGCFNVAEGRVVLEDGNYSFSTYTYNYLGLPTLQGTANPELVLDGANVNGNADNAFTVANGFTADNSFATGARLVLTNGAHLLTMVNGLTFGSGSTKDMTNDLVVADSRLSCDDTLALNESGNTKVVARMTAHDALLRVNGFQAKGPLFLDAARSCICGYPGAGQAGGGPWGVYTPHSASVSNPNPAETGFYFMNSAAAGSELVFRDRTILNVGCFRATTDTYNPAITVAFDDAIVTNGYSSDCAIAIQGPASFKFEVRKGGVTFPVSCGQTLRNVMQLVGVGGLTKTGAGTLVFDSRETAGAKYTADPLTLCYTGVTTVAEGTLVLSNASVRAGAEIALEAGTTLDLSGESWNLGTVAGAGTVRNGTLVGTCLDLAPTNAVTVPGTLVLGENLTVTSPSVRLMVADDGKVPGHLALGAHRFTGTVNVTLVRDAAHVLKPTVVHDGLVIGTYTGEAPDVSAWRVRGLSVRGSVTAADGELRLKLWSSKGIAFVLE